ncbi:carbohydrate ABC transporter permease [Orenia marismortui]|uniref:Carbohydrate ABC transporter membrane protein 1 (CUT1 family) n=1 Tax=Orenia marismortui TaxID=46469 RepID=A0A4V3GYA2_9FIRM|nr:sugar ABC transporter permease [Orenia marismortui]TDX51525.1 carbohydrate ABC transporter membrane protein 1 (CUT1 family) [Orenia marismortui]
MKQNKKERFISFLFVLPSIIAILIFVYGFIAKTVEISLLNWDDFATLLRGEKNYVWFENYIDLFNDQRFLTDLKNIVFFSIYFIAYTLALGIVLALIINGIKKGRSFFKSIFLFPMAISFVISGTVWRWIFAPGTLPNNPEGINFLLGKIGLSNLQWEWFISTDSSFFGFNVALIPIVIVAIWQFSGYIMALWLSGIRGIPKSLIEAARVDGASNWQIFRRVLFPMLKPLTLSAIVILAHISLKFFALIYAMTGSGPNNVTDIPAIYMFEAAFKSNRYSTGASIAVVLLILVGILIIPYLSNNYREDG